MDARPRPSASVVAAGVVAIIGGSLCAFSFGVAFLVTSRVKLPQSGPVMPPALRPLVYGTWIFFLLCAVFVIVTGIGILRLRSWARIALLVIAGLALLFGVVGIGAIVSMIYVSPSGPAVSKAVLASILAFVYGVPLIVSFWWLILFTRRSVTEQFLAAASFESASTRPSSSLLNNPECPLAVRIVGWYLASFVLFLPVLPFVPASSFPALYFGHLWIGPKAILAHFLTYSLMAVCGIGLLRLKRWGYLLAVASQILSLLTGFITAANPALENQMLAAVSAMGMPEPLPAHTVAMLHQIRYLFFLGLLIPLAVLVVLLLFRRPFFAAEATARGLSVANR